MEKNQEFIVTIEDMNEDGAGVGKVDGYIWFVKDAVIGDVVQAKAMKMKKSYGFARLMEVLEPSAARVIPSCPVARQCGGCQLQAMSYEEQLKFKERPDSMQGGHMPLLKQRTACWELRRIGRFWIL